MYCRRPRSSSTSLANPWAERSQELRLTGELYDIVHLSLFSSCLKVDERRTRRQQRQNSTPRLRTRQSWAWMARAWYLAASAAVVARSRSGCDRATSAAAARPRPAKSNREAASRTLIAAGSLGGRPRSGTCRPECAPIATRVCVTSEQWFETGSAGGRSTAPTDVHAAAGRFCSPAAGRSAAKSVIRREADRHIRSGHDCYWRPA